MLDPLSRKVALAPIDDEPFTQEDRQAVAVADEWLKHNAPIPLEHVLADFGLTMADWAVMGRLHYRRKTARGMAKGAAFTEQAKADLRAIPQPIPCKFSEHWLDFLNPKKVT